MEQRRGRRHGDRKADYRLNREDYIRCLESKLKKAEKEKEKWERKAYVNNLLFKIISVILMISLMFSIAIHFSSANSLKDSNDNECNCSTTLVQETNSATEEKEKANVIDNNTFKNERTESEATNEVIIIATSNDEYCYNISQDDKLYIAKVVYAEARGESLEGKVAVANCILNRYFYGEGMGFDRESIYSVITQANQFASINGITIENLNQNPECLEAVEEACKGWDPTREVFENGAFFFYNPDKLSAKAAADRENILTMRIENHLFHENFEKLD